MCFLWIDDWILESLYVDKFLRFDMIFIYIECLNSLICYDLRIYSMLNLPCSMHANWITCSITHNQPTLYIVWVHYCYIFQLGELTLYPNWVKNNPSSYDKILGLSLNPYCFFFWLISLKFILLFWIVVLILSCSIFGWKKKTILFSVK